MSNLRAMAAAAQEINSPVFQISEVFKYQSYFDSTLLQKAILDQPLGQPIVPSTKKFAQAQGYAVGLCPSSQTPIAISFKTGGQAGSSGPIIMKPGQIVRPAGVIPGKSNAFSGFDWGLPYGWLGGGMATLYVFPTPDADVRWAEGAEVIFHRARYAVKQPSDLTAAGSFNNAPKNWPLRFPWTQAVSGSNSYGQQGKAAIAIAEPTRTLLVLRTAGAALANPATMRVMYQGTNDVGLDSASAVSLTEDPVFDDIIFPSYSNLGTSGHLAAQDPGLLYTGLIARLAADDGGICLVDASGTAALNGLFVDICRYGRL